MISAANTSLTVWYAFGGVGVLMAAAAASGLLLGQFRRGVIRELRESLTTAQTEIGINRQIVNRLEDSIRKVEARCGTLEHENSGLRIAVETGAALVPFVQAEFAKFERSVIARHQILAQALPDPVKTALIESLRSEH